MHLVMTWLFPLAVGALWMGIHTVQAMPRVAHRSRTQALQLIRIGLVPLLIWLTVQIPSHLGGTP